MKKIYILLIVIITVLTAFKVGLSIGKRHVIENSIIWTENNIVCIEIDGNIYQHETE